MCPLVVKVLHDNISPNAGFLLDMVFPDGLWWAQKKVGDKLADRLHGARVVRHIFVKSVGIVGAQLTVRRVRRMFNDMSCLCSFDSYFSAGVGALRADCKTLLSRSDEAEG